MKQSSQDNELKFSTLKNKEDEKTRSSMEEENQNQRVKKMTTHMIKIKNLIMNQALEQMKTKVDE